MPGHLPHSKWEKQWIPWTEDEQKDFTYFRWALFCFLTFSAFLYVVLLDDESIFVAYAAGSYAAYLVTSWIGIRRAERGGYWIRCCPCERCVKRRLQRAGTSVQHKT